MAIPDVAPSRQPSSRHVSSSRQAFFGLRFRLDGSVSRLSPKWPRYLAQEPIARVVVASLRHGVLLGHYDLGAYAILSNHVHVLLLPKISPSRLLQSLKGTTARQANLILRRTGETFWQAESYDHWVRDEGEWRRIVAYIEDNPVKARLVQHPEDYRWSSASQPRESAETSLGAADMSVCATDVSAES